MLPQLFLHFGKDGNVRIVAFAGSIGSIGVLLRLVQLRITILTRILKQKFDIKLYSTPFHGDWPFNFWSVLQALGVPF